MRGPSRGRWPKVALVPLLAFAVASCADPATGSASGPPSNSVSASAPASPAPATTEPSRPGTGTQIPGLPGDYGVMMVGDSQPLTLVLAYEPGDVKGLSPVIVNFFGCGVIPMPHAIGDQPMPYTKECDGWARQDRAAAIAKYDADLGVLFAGSWDQYDHWRGDGPVPYTDPRWMRANTRAYVDVLNEIHAHSRGVAAVLNHCHGAPRENLSEQDLYVFGRYPPVINDPKRVAAVNTALKRAVAQVDFPVTVIDPNPLLCKGGRYQGRIRGVEMRTDGLHYTNEGADLVWKWLGPRLVEAARQAEAEGSR